MRLTLAAVMLCTVVAAMPEPAAAQAASSAPPPVAAQPAPAAQPSAKGRLREEQRAYIGREVRVHLTDGTTARGRLIGETDQGLAIQPAPSDEPMMIPYEQVESIATGMPRWKKIAMGVGAAGVAVALAVAMN